MNGDNWTPIDRIPAENRLFLLLLRSVVTKAQCPATCHRLGTSWTIKTPVASLPLPPGWYPVAWQELPPLPRVVN